ncbi:hypothetical protein [uncultured Sneathiella sp.]|jgi:hypothetical protein|uniref:hypothetical protein n=1 Tax=uncultured Sneathiella sp. TaxID=879315 RepID=UPI0030DBAE5F|tara:strand:- start:32916 stop:33239 length:324 start_codon:yes stop_codon:yes gene_type:complete
MRASIFAVLLLMLAACGTSFSQLSARDQLLLTCDGLATTMGIVKNFIVEGTIREAATLARIRAASVVVEESCTDHPDYAAALNRLTAQSVILLEARLKAETETGKRS